MWYFFLLFLFYFFQWSHVYFLLVHRSSEAKQTCSSILKSTWERPSLTSVLSVPKPSPTPRTCPSTLASTWESSPIAVRSASASSRNYLICSSTFAPTRATSLTSAAIRDVTRLSASCPTYRAIPDVIKLTSHTNVTLVTNVLRTRPPSWSTFPNIRRANILRLTFANIVAKATHRRPTCRSTCRSTLNDQTKGLPSQPMGFDRTTHIGPSQTPPPLKLWTAACRRLVFKTLSTLPVTWFPVSTLTTAPRSSATPPPTCLCPTCRTTLLPPKRRQHSHRSRRVCCPSVVAHSCPWRHLHSATSPMTPSAFLRRTHRCPPWTSNPISSPTSSSHSTRSVITPTNPLWAPTCSSRTRVLLNSVQSGAWATTRPRRRLGVGRVRRPTTQALPYGAGAAACGPSQ